MPDIAPGMNAPLWLLQKDDTRSLYSSLILSVTVHIILFVFLAATRIFHPFTGASKEFDLVWFSPVPVSSPIKSLAPQASVTRPIKAQSSRIEVSKPDTSKKIINEFQSSSHVSTIAPQPAPAAPAQKQGQSPNEAPTEEPAEMVISRYDGKVVDIVAKKSDIPTFTIISSVKMKSKSARTVVQTIHEATTKTDTLLKATPKTKTSEALAVVPLTKTPPTKKAEGADTLADVPTPAKKTSSGQHVANEKPVQNKISSASAAALEKSAILPPVNRSINSFAAALAALSKAKNNPVAGEQVSQKLENGITSDKKALPLQVPSKPKLATLPVSVEKPVPQETKSAPQPPLTPPMIFHPPVTGDLKLIIYGDVDAKVDVSFRPFPKDRRSKPFTRREAENHRNIIPIFVRTKENIHEAVVEVTEEGIYTIILRPDIRKGESARLVLKIHESHRGATTKDLGTRKIDGVIEIAKILMPEGILWSEGSNFTGDMEDADSVTKFNSETGLMWREYK